MKYVIREITGCPLNRECGHEKWDMHCQFEKRAVYFAHYDEERKAFVASGLPIMFLRDYGMEEAANELIDAANG